MFVILILVINTYGDLHTVKLKEPDMTTCHVRAIEIQKQAELDNPEASEIGVGCIRYRGEKT